MRKQFLLSLALLLLTASGCGNPFSQGATQSSIDSNFHPGMPSSTSNDAPSPSVALAFGSVGGIKLGPGGTAATGSTIAASAVVSPTNRRVSGTTISGKFSITKFQVR